MMITTDSSLGRGLDNRLYRESPKEPVKSKPAQAKGGKVSRKSKKGAPAAVPVESPIPSSVPLKPWELVCRTIDDWNTFPERFSHSKQSDEKYLYQLLTEDIRPQVIEDLQVINLYWDNDTWLAIIVRIKKRRICKIWLLIRNAS